MVNFDILPNFSARECTKLLLRDIIISSISTFKCVLVWYQVCMKEGFKPLDTICVEHYIQDEYNTDHFNTK
jgi:O-glycosyl hydrolase